MEEALLCTAVIAARRGARQEAGMLARAASTRFEKRRRMAAEELAFRRIKEQLPRDVRETEPRTSDSAAEAAETLSDRDAIDLGVRALQG